MFESQSGSRQVSRVGGMIQLLTEAISVWLGSHDGRQQSSVLSIGYRLE